jgi:uncharacterized repeat protein (TIGR03803 family)
MNKRGSFREGIIRSGKPGIVKERRGKTMKRLRIPLVIVLLVVAGRTFNAGAQTETNLYSFGNSLNYGVTPYAGLVQGSDGNFYGTTANGGMNGEGTVFRISPSGTETTLYSFVGSPTDGAAPFAVLVQGNDGNLYGTTTYGGSTNNCFSGCGTVFRISPSGSYTSLYSFVGSPNDGAEPVGGLVQGSDGYFYGTTAEGGTNNGGTYDGGTVFRISSSGTETTLYSFVGSPSDGAYPRATLVQGSDGYFYGTTLDGGADGFGTVFLVTPSGYEATLYSFGSIANDGGQPGAGLVQGSDGNFYGTTIYGGMNYDGTVFRISPSGSYTSLYSFVGSPTDGYAPFAGLVQGSDGNFYGTTVDGGTSTNCSQGCGTVFQISPSGSYTSLYSFVGSPTDGYPPYAGLVQGSDGNFYGTTVYGGASTNYSQGAGIVFRFSVPLNPPPNQISKITRNQALLLTVINISIPSVAGETYQLQFTTNLTSGTWSNIPGASVTNSIGSILTLSTRTGSSQPQGFYRFDITP